MLRQAEIELTLPEGEKLNQSMGSVLHGALMGIISPDWAATMHEEKVRPYSQYVTLKEGKLYWRIQTLTEEAFDEILVPLMKQSQLTLKQRGYPVGLSHFRIARQETFADIEERCWSGRRIHHIDMDFLTSTSFKTNGTYAIFPDPRLLFVSLVRKWNAFSDASIIDEPDLIDHLASQLDISDYHLHMHPFSVEGRRIRAFRGNVTYGFFKNDMAKEPRCHPRLFCHVYRHRHQDCPRHGCGGDRGRILGEETVGNHGRHSPWFPVEALSNEK